jgi:hypothetical protein
MSPLNRVVCVPAAVTTELGHWEYAYASSAPSESRDPNKVKHTLLGRRSNPFRGPMTVRLIGADGIEPSTTPTDDPALLQRIKHEGSVLSLAVSDDYIFAGTQRKDILV